MSWGKFIATVGLFGAYSEVKKIDGQKVQEVRIIYNFVGEIPEIIV